MKRIIAVVLAVLLLLSLFGGCAIVSVEDREEETPEAASVTKKPKHTEAPEVTETPEPTEEPEPTETPEPTEEPEVAETPEPTEEPEPTETPAPTEEPGPEESPDPGEEPVSAQDPEGGDPAPREEWAVYAGIYRMSMISADGMTVSSEAYAKLAGISLEDARNIVCFALQADGTALLKAQGELSRANWSVEGDTLILVDLDGVTLECTIRDGVITLEAEGVVVEMTLDGEEVIPLEPGSRDREGVYLLREITVDGVTLSVERFAELREMSPEEAREYLSLVLLPGGKCRVTVEGETLDAQWIVAGSGIVLINGDTSLSCYFRDELLVCETEDIVYVLERAPEETALLGRYGFNRVTSGDTVITPEEYAEMYGIDIQEARDAIWIELLTGGRAILNEEGEVYEATWRRKGDRIILEDETGTVECLIGEGTLTLMLEDAEIELKRASIGEMIQPPVIAIDPEEAEKLYLGVYRLFRAVTEEGIVLTLEEVAQLMGLSEEELRENMRIELQAGGKGNYSADGFDGELEWRMEGDRLILTEADDILECGYRDGIITIDAEGITLMLRRDPEEGEERYLGTYRFSGISTEGLELTVEEYAELLEMDLEDARNFFVLELLPDGAAAVSSDGETVDCTWQLDGDRLLLTAEGETVEGTVGDGTIRLDMDSGTLFLSRDD